MGHKYKYLLLPVCNITNMQPFVYKLQPITLLVCLNYLSAVISLSRRRKVSQPGNPKVLINGLSIKNLLTIKHLKVSLFVYF